MPERPYLKPWYRTADDGGRLVFEYAQTAVVFEGKAARALLPALLPLLDGTRTVAEVAAAIGPGTRAAVENALQLLGAKRLLLDGPPLDARDPARETAEFLAATSGFALTPAQAASALRAARTGVAGETQLAEEAARLLLRSGVGHVDRVSWEGPGTTPFELVLALPSPGELPRLGEWNRALLAARVPWLQVLPYDGVFAAVGPLYLPGETCCYDCYRLRRASNLGYPTEFWPLEARPAPFPAAPPASTAALAVAATLALRWLAFQDALVPGRLHALELSPPFSLTVHHVYRVPRCNACSDVARGPAPLPWFKEARAVA